MTDSNPSLAQVRASLHIHDVDTVAEWFREFNEGVKRARRAEPIDPAPKRAPYSKVTPAQIADMRERRARGETLHQIAAAVGVSHATVCRRTKDVKP